MPSHLEREVAGLKPGDEIELYVFLNNDVGYDWEPAIVLEVDPLRIRWADGSGEKDWARPGARIPGIRMKPEPSPPAPPKRDYQTIEPMTVRAADRLYDECARAIKAGRIDARSPIGDATLDYRDTRFPNGDPENSYVV